MKIWLIITLMWSFTLIFTSEVNSQSIPWKSTKAKIEFSESHRLIKEGAPKKKASRPKFGILLGIGNGYKSGDRVTGREPYDNSLIYSIRLEYAVCKILDLQGDYSNVTDFRFYRPQWQFEAHQRITNYGINAKIKAPFVFRGKNIAPYFIGGIGKARHTTEGAFTGIKWKHSGVANYRKTGVGIQVGINKNVFVFYEYAYYNIGLLIYDDGDPNTSLAKYRVYYSATLGGIGWRF